MNSSSIREALLALESVDPELERRYRERVRGMAERRLTGAARVGHGIGLVVALLTAARVVQLWTQHGADRPIGAIGLAVALAFCLGWVWAEAAVLRSGVDRLLTNGLARMQLVVGFTFAVVALMAWAGLDANDVRGTHEILFGLAIWCVIGLPFLLVHQWRASELRTRMDLLRLELALLGDGAKMELRP